MILRKETETHFLIKNIYITIAMLKIRMNDTPQGDGNVLKNYITFHCYMIFYYKNE